MLKSSANAEHGSIVREYINKRVVGAYSIFFTSTILTIIAYRGVELKRGPILESAGYIYVLFLSWIFLKEKITGNKIMGTILIIGGIYVFGL
ncbi:MAG: EamA family transporter [Syntrophomonas sp.]